MGDPTENLPRAHGGPAGTGQAKAAPEDFVVEEVLGFELSGDGEHVFLKIEKRGENTEYVARRLARHAGISVRNVGYAGLKDRHGRTVQWYSVQLPGKEGPDWRELESDSLRVLATGRNNRKLRKGAAAGNRFQILVREVRAERERLEAILNRCRDAGIPNYFGAQRFGQGGGNLDRARELFENPGFRPSPHERGLYLSAARSEIFNRILALRVERRLWDQPVPGDAFMFQGSGSFFASPEITDDIRERNAARAIHPAGTLWGRGQPAGTGTAAALESEAVAGVEDLCRGLERFDLETSCRPLRVCPENLRWDFPEPCVLRLDFGLPPGAYATALLRELFTDPSAPG
jgi:tRNA pseudouridine13 synthase